MRANKTLEALEPEKLAEVFRRYPQVRAAYLFGSQAAGRAGRGSDLDLAIIPTDPSLKENKLDILAELARRGYCNVDLVLLDEDDLVLAYEAIRLNRLIYAGPGFDRGATYSRVVRKYLDFEPTCGSNAKRTRGGSPVLRPEATYGGTQEHSARGIMKNGLFHGPEVYRWNQGGEEGWPLRRSIRMWS